ncbi:TNF receptor-associated factor 5 isoform X1 [Conger conger]|uniref:TNF receptor-associated factor 5 isoform X1 n=1 Tax=Conger conger TaxID=82655 RepID=UPI002A5A88E2|nr:TNF receptor-associated factor 5 isoform X1 [Conger conger]
MATEGEDEGLPQQHWGVFGSEDLDSRLLSHTLRFVETLEAQYLCPCCSGVVINPHQASCGHIFCLRCIRALLENGLSAKCPKDHAFIKSNEVFQDNCCKREIQNLDIYCTNYPACAYTFPLCHLQEHLKTCQFEIIKCPNQDCPETLPCAELEDHTKNHCLHRLEPCPHCHQQLTLTHMKDHENTVCPEVKVPCPNKCTQMMQRHMLKEHFSQCPELETDCVYKKYGCSVREKRAKVLVHEDAALNEHLLLVLENNTKLEKQIHSLQQGMSVGQEQLQDQRSAVSSLERAVQQVTKDDLALSSVQRSLEDQRGRVSNIQLQLKQLSLAFGQDSTHTELAQLRGSLGTLSQQVSVIEGLKEQLGVLEDRYLQHSRLLDIHVDQLQRNEERFQELESTSYTGKLIWKIRDYQKRKEAASRGHAPVMLSSAFYTGRSGYKLSARAYLSGDGAGRGTHLSLYVVLMRGDFDSLLPWPFRQTISLSLLDQSPARNHVSESFLPDPASSSFARPVSDTNVASGFPRFVSHGNLEAPKNAAYVKDDTLFIKIRVDTSSLEDL